MISLCIFLFGGCKASNQEGDKNAGGEKAAQKTHKGLSIKGSDTMVHLTSSWAEEFMKINIGSEVSVTGGGSGTGIAALINATTDICAASREINDKELSLAAAKNLKPQGVAVALDGIAIIINQANPVSFLSQEELKKIFTGEFTNWKQLGGPDQAILVLSRESSSGTYVFFQEHVLSKADYTERAKLLPGTSAVVQSIATDKWAIGYVGLGFAQKAGKDIKTVAVRKDDKSSAVEPSVETVKAGLYPIARKLYFYIGEKLSAQTQQFVDFCLSDKGQAIVQETGYVTIK
ncbi:MAG: hypothetical protein A2511_13865 [Deltaproteobacteria bacterium RIFOXYD12_FULL_50_9]|nr:MAG: hypothetical protein A2511_13865 [Deltaproteobacteria bacterium RIFOXYD12_FULL_50_9]